MRKLRHRGGMTCVMWYMRMKRKSQLPGPAAVGSTAFQRSVLNEQMLLSITFGTNISVLAQNMGVTPCKLQSCGSCLYKVGL